MSADVGKLYTYDTKPARLQTVTGWRRLGWHVPADAVATDVLATQYGRSYLYPYSAVINVPGRRALVRRVEFMLQYVHGAAKAVGALWMNSQALVGLITDEEIQDMATAWTPTPADFFFADSWEWLPPDQLADRCRFGFELGALAAQGRSYADYRYNEF